MMKKIMKSAISLLLCFVMLLSIAPMQELIAWAATIGGRAAGSTGLDAGSYTDSDFVSLPIEIYDYRGDGMLFEFSSPTAKGSQTIVDTYGRWGSTRGFNFNDYYTNLKAPTGDGYGNSRKLNGGFTISYKTSEKTAKRYVRFTQKSAYDQGVIELRAVTLGAFSTAVKNTDVQYMAIVYRGSGLRGSGVNVLFRNNAGDEPMTVDTITLSSTTTWKAAVFNIGDATGTYGTQWDGFDNGGVKYISLNPFSSESAGSYYLDIAYVAFFPGTTAGKNAANALNAACVRTYSMEDNHAFGLVGSAATSAGTIQTDGTNMRFRRISATYYPGNSVHNTGSYFNENTYTITDGKYNTTGVTSIWQLHPDRVSNISNMEAYLGYNLIATLGGAAVTAGMLKPELVDGLPQYKEETVYYIAKLLQKSLPIAEKDSSGVYSYAHIMGESWNYDRDSANTQEQLADLLRSKITGGLGTYQSTKSKKLIGTWEETFKNITTYMDAAYFLLNNLFVANSYNSPYTNYHHLVLNKAKVGGKDVYVFDAGFGNQTDGATSTSAMLYQNGVISNSSAASKPLGYYGTSSTELTTYYPFLPLTTMNNRNGMTRTPYQLDDGAWVIGNDFRTYENRNYNYVLKSHGSFSYESGLFFEFEGDDDVYLFINGQLVLDMGGAHPIAKQTIYLDKYVADAKASMAADLAAGREPSARDKALAMSDGEAATFDFFYMERHGYGANMRIVTNIRVMDTNIDTTKSAYQNGAEIPEGGVINVDERVEFCFKLTNSGDIVDDMEINGRLYASLYDLTFTDPKLNLQIGPNGINTKYGGTTVKATDANGGALEFNDLIFYHIAADGTTMHQHTFDSLDALKTYLTNPENGAGLRPKESILIRGVYTKLSDTDFNSTTKLYTNTIQVSANSGAGTNLRDEDPVTLRNLPPIKYYMWAGHEVRVSKADLLTDINNAITAGAITGVSTISSIKSAYVSLASGVPVDDAQFKWESNILLLRFSTPGAYMKYLTVEYTSGSTTGKVTVPIQIFVMNVKNHVFVLDYGLPVDLSANGALQVGDTVSVPGRATNWFYEGSTALAPTYLFGTGGNNLTINPDAMEGTYYFVVSASYNSTNPDGTTNVNGSWALNAPADGSNITGVQVSTANTVSDSDIATAQKFHVRAAGDGYYTIQSSQTGKYLTIGARNTNHPTLNQDRYYIAQTAYTGADNQLWKFGSTSDGYTTIANKASESESVSTRGLCYLYYASMTKETSAEIISGASINRYFKWNMVKVKENNYAGTWTLTTADSDQFALAVTDSSMESGAGLCLWKNDGSTSFNFTFHVAAIASDGIYYTIKSDFNDLYLTNLSNNAGNYEVAMQKYTGANSQLWKVTPGTTKGTVCIQSLNCARITDETNAMREAVLDVVTDEYKNGDAVKEHIDDAYTSGQWILTPAGYDGGEFDFDKNNGILTYTPGDFMEDAETIYILVRVHESGFTASNIGTTDVNNEVEMYKAVTVIPASVIYYEDDFPSIHYSETTKNTITDDGTSSDGLWQSNDQNEQYGHDRAYEGEFDVTTSGNGSYHKVTITNATDMNDPAAWFEFTGTGFELISRTNARDAASLFVRIMQGDKLIRLIPVITEFDSDANGAEDHGEEIYQVPVIKVDDLPYGKYTVQIIGVAAYDYSKTPYEIIPTVFYLDGIRIFNPVGGGNMVDLENEYSTTEQDATFVELRDLISDGKALAATWAFGSDDEGNESWTFGSSMYTYTENRVGHGMTGEIIGNTVEDLSDYMVVGPNNEVYMDANSEYAAIGFYVKCDGTPADNTLQIGVRLLDDSMFYIGEPGVPVAGLSVGGKDANNNAYGWYTLVDALSSGTEQYYVIDYTACPTVTIGGETYYQVVISVDFGMVSFTSVKYKGLTIKENAYDGANVRYNNGELETYDEEAGDWLPVADKSKLPDFFALGNQFLSTRRLEPKVPGDDYVPPCEAEKPAGPEGNPNTGDDAMIPVFSGLLLASLFGLAVLLLTKRKETV